MLSVLNNQLSNTLWNYSYRIQSYNTVGTTRQTVDVLNKKLETAKNIIIRFNFINKAKVIILLDEYNLEEYIHYVYTW